MVWPGMKADIKDYTRRCQVCIKRSRPAREPLQPHEIPDGPWMKLGMDFFDLKGKCYILICDYFSKFPFMFSCKTSWCSLRDRLIDLFANKGYSREIISNNGSPFNSQEFADFLSSHGVRHTTSSPHYPQSNGFIERQIQTVKNLLYKALDAGTWSFQDVLAELRSTKIGNGLPSPAEILHGRSLITGEPVTADHVTIKAVLIDRQIKDSQHYNKSLRVKIQRALVLGERCWGTGTNNIWQECYITGIDKENRCYQVVFENTGRTMRRTRSHLSPRGPDFPHLSEHYMTMCLTLVQMPKAVWPMAVAHWRAALAPHQPRGPVRRWTRPPARPAAALQAAMAQPSQTALPAPHRHQDGPVHPVLRKL